MVETNETASERADLLRMYTTVTLASWISILGWGYANYDYLVDTPTALPIATKFAIIIIAFVIMFIAHAICVWLHIKQKKRRDA